MELAYEGTSTIGASYPGVPHFLYGKGPNWAWSVTSALTDLSDLYRESLSPDEKKYKVDG
jgi:acyl-homoserine lactone acylase PvdQ